MILVSSRNFEDYCSVPNLVLSHVIKWFSGNNLVLNLDEMNMMKFITKSSSYFTLHFGYKEKSIKEKVNTKFLGLQLITT